MWRSARSARVLLGAALAVASGGCAAMLTDTAREVTPAVIAGAVEGITDPATQQKLVAAIDERQVKLMSARLSAGVVDGVLDTLEDPKRRRRLEAILSGLTATAAGAAMDSMLDHALGDSAQARMQLAMRGTVTELVTVLFDTVGARTGTSEEQALVFGAAAHEIAKQATLGFQDALDETRRDRESGVVAQEDGALIIAAGQASATGDRILWTLGIGLGAVSLGLAITLIWAIRKNRLRRFELEKRNGALLMLTKAIESSQAAPGGDDLHGMLEALRRDLASNSRPSSRWSGLRHPEH